MRFSYLTLFCLLVVFAGCERKAVVKGIDLESLAAKNPQLSLVGDNVRIRVTPTTEAPVLLGGLEMSLGLRHHQRWEWK
jgi:hypothetical protein